MLHTIIIAVQCFAEDFTFFSAGQWIEVGVFSILIRHVDMPINLQNIDIDTANKISENNDITIIKESSRNNDTNIGKKILRNINIAIRTDRRYIGIF